MRDASLKPFSRRKFLAVSGVALSGASLAAPYVTQAKAAASESMIGEMLMLGFAGSSVDAAGPQDLLGHVSAGRVGGVCFLGYNTRSRAGVEGLTQAFANAAGGRKLLVAVDQEGGAVQRLGPKLGYPAVPPALNVATHHDVAGARAIYKHLAEIIRQAGFNLNLAPVVDLGFEPANPIVTHFGRAFGPDGASVARYAGAFIEGHHDAGILTALKHFPGHGSTLSDSHAKPVDLTATWREDEIEPYRKLNESGLIDIVMSGHLAHAKLTSGEPATLSHKAIDTWLRGTIGYNGVVMTDDLDMAAIRSSFSLKDAIVRAVAAGNDLILLSNSAAPDPDLPNAAIDWIKEGVASGQIPANRIENSVARLAALKAKPWFHAAAVG